MGTLRENILNCLKDLKGSGKFISVHTTEFQFPGLEVNGVGEIAYPINEMQAKALIQVAQKAPFGKGSETIVDSNVRSASEIDASQLNFKGERWAAFSKRCLLCHLYQGFGLHFINRIRNFAYTIYFQPGKLKRCFVHTHKLTAAL